MEGGTNAKGIGTFLGVSLGDQPFVVEKPKMKK
jgi:hypothetical protein